MTKYVEKFCIDCGAYLGMRPPQTKRCPTCKADREAFLAQRRKELFLSAISGKRMIVPGTPWSEKEDEYLIEVFNTPQFSLLKACMHLRRSAHSVAGRIHVLRDKGVLKKKKGKCEG